MCFAMFLSVFGTKQTSKMKFSTFLQLAGLSSAVLAKSLHQQVLMDVQQQSTSEYSLVLEQPDQVASESDEGKDGGDGGALLHDSTIQSPTLSSSSSFIMTEKKSGVLATGKHQDWTVYSHPSFPRYALRTKTTSKLCDPNVFQVGLGYARA